MPLSDVVRKSISLIDHTSLNAEDTEESITAFLKNAFLPGELHPAAICVYPKFTSLCKRMYPTARVAVVINFPLGKDPESDVLRSAREALQAGADELDLVIDYRLIMDDRERGLKEAAALTGSVSRVCREEGRCAVLKVIIETGELKSAELIKDTSEAVIEAGADFIKTSTGKVPINATLEAARVMLTAIHDWHRRHPQSDRCVGFKAAGGVKTPEQCRDYLSLAESILGPKWVTPKTFRFGASSLLSGLRNALRPEVSAEAKKVPCGAGEASDY